MPKYERIVVNVYRLKSAPKTYVILHQRSRDAAKKNQTMRNEDLVYVGTRSLTVPVE